VRTLTEEETLARLGSPAKRLEYTMAEAGDEFRIELQNTYPLTKPENRGVRIHEWTWNRGDERLTVWFHKPADAWRAFHLMRWHKGMEF